MKKLNEFILESLNTNKKFNNDSIINESVFARGGHLKDSIETSDELFDKLQNNMKGNDYEKWKAAVLKDSDVKKACKFCDSKMTKLVLSGVIDSFKETDGDVSGEGEESNEEMIDNANEYWFEMFIYNALAFTTDDLGYDGYDEEMREWGNDVDTDELVLAIEQVFIKLFL